MTTPTIEKIREGQVLSLGRELAETLVKRTSAPGAPYQTGDDGEGVALVDGLDAAAMLLVAGVRLSARPRHSGATVEITTLDEATTYTVTLNSTGYDYVTQVGDSIEDVIDGLVTAIGSNEESPSSTAVSPQKTPVYDEDNTLTGYVLDLLGGLDSTWTGGVGASGGSGAMTYERDATTVSYRLWIEWPWGWGRVPGEVFTDEAESQFDRYIVAGARRAHVEITATDGRVYEVYGVGVLDATEGS